ARRCCTASCAACSAAAWASSAAASSAWAGPSAPPRPSRYAVTSTPAPIARAATAYSGWLRIARATAANTSAAPPTAIHRPPVRGLAGLERGDPGPGRVEPLLHRGIVGVALPLQPPGQLPQLVVERVHSADRRHAGLRGHVTHRRRAELGGLGSAEVRRRGC